MAKITIHTATYNRAYILDKAYNSLVAQTNKNFEWIITDDGSTDNTEELIKTWQGKNNGFDIIYNKLNHVGIPRALNSGVNKASTEWFMMLDSDDYLMPDTVEKVIKWLQEIENDSTFAGIGFAKCFPNGDYMKPQTPIIDNLGFVDASHIERKKYNLNMDMCEVHRVKLMRQFPFQVWYDEEFAPEQLNYYEIALAGYKLRWRNEKLSVCEYLEDGMTKNDRIVKNNPMGFAMMYNQNILLSSSMFEKATNIVRMIALSFYAGHPEYILDSNDKFLAILLLPFGYALSIRRKMQYRKLK